MERYKIEYFKWEDIRAEICKELGIRDVYFRDYHKVVGGAYKDLWYEWIEYFDGGVMDFAVTSCTLTEDVETKVQYVIDDNKPWLESFVRAIYKLWNEYNIEHIKYD